MSATSVMELYAGRRLVHPRFLFSIYQLSELMEM